MIGTIRSTLRGRSTGWVTAQVANNEVIEIRSDDDEPVEPDAETRARLDAAATQKAEIEERSKRRRTDGDRDAAAAVAARDWRRLTCPVLTAHCRARGLATSGRKDLLVARLVRDAHFGIKEGPRGSTVAIRRETLQFANNLPTFIVQNDPQYRQMTDRIMDVFGGDDGDPFNS